MQTRVLVPSGVLGLGFDREALERGMMAKPDIICIDGGSTDSGPFYLGTGTSKYAREVCKAEWRILMIARAAANIPLVIGSCGTCGSKTAVDWMYDITVELAHELNQSIRITTLYSDQSQQAIIKALKEDKLLPLMSAPQVTPEQIKNFTNIVALAGAEQINAALQTGADIILAGRTTDTALISALPLSRGNHAGAAWHGAKIAECGAFCSTRPSSGVILVEFDKVGFTVEAMATDALCTPYSVFAHMLYENVDPFILFEPGGHLDVRAAHYTALDAHRVRVEGAQWIKSSTYTVKLEATHITGFQTTMMAVIREARYVEKAQIWVDRLNDFLHEKITNCMALDAEEYTLDFRLIGINAALGDQENKARHPIEVGVLLIITAADQETATELSKLINPFLLHYPLTNHEDLPTFAFPYSPTHSDRGALYEFSLNHVCVLDDPMDGFILQTSEVSCATAG